MGHLYQFAEQNIIYWTIVQLLSVESLLGQLYNKFKGGW